MRLLLLLLLVTLPGLAQELQMLARPPAGVPQDLPAKASGADYLPVNLGAQGRVLLRFFRVPRDEYGGDSYLDVLVPDGARWRRRSRQQVEAGGAPDDTWELRWLRPAEKQGPLITARSEDSLVVILFPGGLKGPVYLQVFSDFSTSISSTSAFLERDETGQTLVVEETIEPEGPKRRQEYRWTGKAWK